MKLQPEQNRTNGLKHARALYHGESYMELPECRTETGEHCFMYRIPQEYSSTDVVLLFFFTGKLVIQEAFDEDTSDFPNGRHENESVFYEGRGAEMSITKANAFSPAALETDDYVQRRLSELAVCANFAYVAKEDAKVSACVERKPKRDRRKRSLLSRTRRSGHVEHTMVKDLLEKLGKTVLRKKKCKKGPSSKFNPLGYCIFHFRNVQEKSIVRKIVFCTPYRIIVYSHLHI
ncbi:hypothetical protein DPMN_137403 [Dreissena polymorpha]|uniref:Uncharacterized protein n=1 Tax=Dreissena polymorpha TaxID=45954 RepID=A0A9D4G5P3_DREPO|nr:hypothetical protein DPMN_137403 [Dreissena polymorpha]